MLTLGDPTIGFPVDGEETKAAGLFFGEYYTPAVYPR
jgi:hypothetical protein